MINPNFTIDNSSMNAVKAKVELYDGSTLVKTCTCSDVLQDFAVNRLGEENKFFGFGICQQLKITLIDLERSLNIAKDYRIKVAYGDGANFVYPHPTFYVEEVTRDEETNSLSIVAYDLLYKATKHTVSEVTPNLVVPFTTFRFFVTSYEVFGGTAARLVNSPQNLTHEELPSFNGTETIRQAMDAAAEISQVVYYLDENDNLELKRLDITGAPVLTITKEDYFTLKTGDNVVLNAICSATELGDNVIHPDVTSGNIHYIRDNPFLALREDMGTLIPACWEKVNGLAINEFICEGWTGNYLLEIGDKIALETEDGGNIVTYVLNDSIFFDGTLSETTQWTYEPSLAESSNNPASLGEVLNQTYAKVDKANKEIQLLVSETEANGNRVSALEVNTNSISASVTTVETNLSEKIDDANEEIDSLKQEVSLKVGADAVTIAIDNERKRGADKVVTSTNSFVFDDTGLTVSKSDSEISTQITEDGMTISKSGEEVLVADNQGVKAEDLHATTYLIIGNNSRIEDWGSRTACFWIGG